MTIRFVSVVGADTGLLDSAITHYRNLGVESFHIARHGAPGTWSPGTASPDLDEYPDTVHESRRMLQRLQANAGRIDVTAEELSLRRCGSDYADYVA
ncbi:hypothetical protein [Streptomyces sp. NPDC058622]|uniref:hypothetical protein n=1 Tax=unclassified Streptomyces TaxID=2593676 RepID=UPI0036669CAE